jgi:hypothetical protein
MACVSFATLAVPVFDCVAIKRVMRIVKAKALMNVMRA